jgi:hypothetical protein
MIELGLLVKYLDQMPLQKQPVLRGGITPTDQQSEH